MALPPITLTQIFKGVLPYRGMVLLAMLLMYQFPAIVFALRDAVHRAK